MKRHFLLIAASGLFIAPVAAKTTLINTSAYHIFLTDETTDNALESLPAHEKKVVLKALYSVKPGESKVLPAGHYQLTFEMEFEASAVLLTEIRLAEVTKPKQPKPAPKPVNPPVEPAPVADPPVVDPQPPNQTEPFTV